ncbi:MAG: alpha-L-fucosidase [Lewinellaceae bacterium]|nr:alpha-L-fucosidase [Lewinellaceae bacterium]
MKNRPIFSLFFLAVFLFALSCGQHAVAQATAPLTQDERMAWWREARFGLFIHWGLYAIPAGTWKGETDYGEWIRHSAHIPLETYDQFAGQFNPTHFDARDWVRMAKEAGMKYIVITSKHHDGFCLFDAVNSDFDIMGTPFKRDVLKELADACHEAGIRLCFYHSIMDWHHPDYLPRRPWETDRPTNGADFDRYVAYMKEQLKQLVTEYGDIGVLWFDGEWEESWTHEYGKEIYDFVRGLDPGILINNRVDKGRGGMQGMTIEGSDYRGDFGTPEQEIPDTGIPGVDWESCMTMNRHWGYNAQDTVWKSTEELLRNLADITSKGGNFLLNVGPMANGEFPPESIERLHGMGQWMAANSEAIYGAEASPFGAFDWGRVTLKRSAQGYKLYLHLFEFPASGVVRLPGVASEPLKAYLLAAPETSLGVQRAAGALAVRLPAVQPDMINTVAVLEFNGPVAIYPLPVLRVESDIFVNPLTLEIEQPALPALSVHYTLDGTEPVAASKVYSGPFQISETTMVKVRIFNQGEPASGLLSRRLEKVAPWPATAGKSGQQGLQYRYYEGDWQSVTALDGLTPKKEGMAQSFSLEDRLRDDFFGYEFQASLYAPADDVYRFFTESDDGSSLYIDGRLVVENDGPHGAREVMGMAPLAKGWHQLRVLYFERDGSEALKVSWQPPGAAKGAIPLDKLASGPGH